MSLPKRHALSRREAFRWILASSATVAQLREQSFAGVEAASSAARAYGADPLINHTYKPGEFWPLTLTTDERLRVAQLADLILPADGKSPAASAVGVPDFIDEWISAPYPQQQNDRKVVLDGLKWLEAESRK